MLVTLTRQRFTLFWDRYRENIFHPCTAWSTLTLVAFWNPEIVLKTCHLNLGKVIGFDTVWTCYEFSNQHTRLQPHSTPSHGPSSFIARLLFEGKEAQGLRQNLTQLSSSEIHACSCPNGDVVFSSKPDFSSYSPAELKWPTDDIFLPP